MFSKFNSLCKLCDWGWDLNVNGFVNIFWLIMILFNLGCVLVNVILVW